MAGQRKKGETLFQQVPWQVFFLSSKEDRFDKQGFPRYNPASPKSTVVSDEVFRILETNKILDATIKDELSVALEIVFQKLFDTLSLQRTDERETMFEFYPLSTEKIWSQHASDLISWEGFVSILAFVRKNIIIVDCNHPLTRYATEIVPMLGADELHRVHKILFPNDDQVSMIRIVKYLQDQAPPIRYGVLLDTKSTLETFSHSCLPNASIELMPLPDGTWTLVVTALFDLKKNDQILVSLIHHDSTGSVEERETAVYRRLGHSCACTRCRYEAEPSAVTSDLLALGHYYLSRGRLFEAESVYQQGRALDEQNDLEWWHALGAIELARGRFLRAQRLWREGAMIHANTFKHHRGIALQMEKITAYKYLKEQRSESCPKRRLPMASRRIGRHAFVNANLVDAETCSKILQWAQAEKWTQERHYAVPTNDVPVHKVPPLLDWFNSFMDETMSPLLAMYYDSSSRYWVHDAFCVRYRGNEVSNHLPIHTDESTHSFILALNEDFEGGGTYFYDLNQTVSLQIGDVLGFRGDELLHGGEAVSRGTRYILAVFLYHDDDADGPGDSPTDAHRHGRKRSCTGLPVPSNQARSSKQEFSFGFQLDH